MAQKTFYKVVSVSALLLVVSSLHAISTLLSDKDGPIMLQANNQTRHLTLRKLEDVGIYGQGQTPSRVGRQILGKDDECRSVHRQDDKCNFVNTTGDCDNDGFFQYTFFTYCLIRIVPLGMVILVAWWLFCFIGLAVCADDFFCPSLVVISKTLRLTPNVAGVTFLAFGNGAPDFFSAISALASGDGETGLGIGGLFGAGMFVTTIVVGTICVVKPFKAMERPFLRDVIFYLGAVFWTFYVLWMKKIRLYDAIGIMVIYPVYVITVIVSSSIYKRQEQAKQNKENTGIVLQSSTAIRSQSMDASTVALSGKKNQAFEPDSLTDQKPTSGPPPLRREDSLANIGLENGYADQVFPDSNGGDGLKAEEGEEEEEPLSWWKMILYGINPINIEEWPDMKWYLRIYEVFKSPIMFAIQLTCPVINYEDEVLHNWNKYLHIVQCILAPLLISFLIKVNNITVAGNFKLWMLMLIIGFLLGVVIMFTSVPDKKPSYHSALGYIGFLVALVWIYVIANEIVSLLETFGVVLNISNAILGLTLLAWGNSIGDWISNVVMARQGFARMGFAACFGAPLFSLGFGIPMVVQIAGKKENYAVLKRTPVNMALSMFLLLSLVSSLVLLPLLRFKVNRIYGLYLLILYIVFLIVALLTETQVLNWDPILK